MNLISLFLCTVYILTWVPDGDSFSPPPPTASAPLPTSGVVPKLMTAPQKLAIQNVDMATFQRSRTEKKTYNTNGMVMAGVLPHHLLAAPLMSGFLTLTAQNTFDTIVIVAPNHNGDLGDVILSDADWQNGVLHDENLLSLLLEQSPPEIRMVVNNQRMAEDHSASVHIPYIAHYFPNSSVFPVLLSKSLSLDNTLLFAQALTKTIQSSNKKVLLLCSIDFSHYLPRKQALEHDTQTLTAIQQRDYTKIFRFSNNNVDSSASLVVFLEYLKLQGLALEVFDHQDATQFSNMPAADTTTYFILGGLLTK